MYTSFIRPHLEYCVPVWNPYLKGDISELEGVQRRVTKVPISTRGLDYEARLKCFGLTSLVTRRNRGDLIELFKITDEIDVVDWDFKLSYVRGQSRGR